MLNLEDSDFKWIEKPNSNFIAITRKATKATLTRVDTDNCKLTDSSYSLETGGSATKSTDFGDGTSLEKLSGSFIIILLSGDVLAGDLTAPSFNFFRFV